MPKKRNLLLIVILLIVISGKNPSVSAPITGVCAIPGQERVYLSWDEVSYDLMPDCWTYYVHKGDTYDVNTGGVGKPTGSCSYPSGTSYTYNDLPVKDEDGYFFVIEAYNGEWGDDSNELFSDPVFAAPFSESEPTAPQPHYATAGPGPGQITFTFLTTPSCADGYWIMWSTNERVNQCDATTSNWTYIGPSHFGEGTENDNLTSCASSGSATAIISGLSDDLRYYIHVNTVDANNHETLLFGYPVSSYPGDVNPKAPQNVSVDSIDGKKELDVSWEINKFDTDVTGYCIFWRETTGVASSGCVAEKTDTDNSDGAVYVSGYNTTSYTITEGLSEDTTYYVVVSAIDKTNHESPVSNVAYATTENLPPPAPEIISAKDSSTDDTVRITVKWYAVDMSESSAAFFNYYVYLAEDGDNPEDGKYIYKESIGNQGDPTEDEVLTFVFDENTHGIEERTTYDIYVSVIDINVDESFAGPNEVTTDNLDPDPVTITRADAHSTLLEIDLEWTKSEEDDFEIYKICWTPDDIVNNTNHCQGTFETDDKSDTDYTITSSIDYEKTYRIAVYVYDEPEFYVPNTTISTNVAVVDTAPDVYPPDQILEAYANDADNTVLLGWRTNPEDDDFAGVLITRRDDATSDLDCPGRIEGYYDALIYSGPGTYQDMLDYWRLDDTDPDLEYGERYCYSFFSYDDAETVNYADRLCACAVLSPIPENPSGYVTIPGDRQITISWDEPDWYTDGETPLTVDHYDVYWIYPVSGVPNYNHDLLTPSGVTETTFTVSVDENNKEYCYGVVAVDSTGEKSNIDEYDENPSLMACATPVDTTPPGPVTGFEATAQNGQVFLEWTNPAGVPDFDGTRIVRGAGTVIHDPDSGTQVNCTFSPTTVTCTDTGLVNCTKYCYTAFAFDDDDLYSSEVIATNTSPAPNDELIEGCVRPTVSGPAQDAGVASDFSAVVGDGQIDMSWTNPECSDLREVTILRWNDDFPDGDDTTGAEEVCCSSPDMPESFSDTDVENGENYCYKAFTKDCEGDDSEGEILVSVTDDNWDSIGQDGVPDGCVRAFASVPIDHIEIYKPEDTILKIENNDYDDGFYARAVFTDGTSKDITYSFFDESRQCTWGYTSGTTPDPNVAVINWDGSVNSGNTDGTVGIECVYEGKRAQGTIIVGEKQLEYITASPENITLRVGETGYVFFRKHYDNGEVSMPLSAGATFSTPNPLKIGLSVLYPNVFIAEEETGAYPATINISFDGHSDSVSVTILPELKLETPKMYTPLVTGSSVSLSWDPVTSHTDASQVPTGNTVNYQLKRYGDGEIHLINTNVTSYVDSTVVPNTAYTYELQASYEPLDGNPTVQSEWSVQTAVSVPVDSVGAPRDFSVDYKNGYFVLEFQPPEDINNVYDYCITRTFADDPDSEPVDLGCHVMGLIESGEYHRYIDDTISGEPTGQYLFEIWARVLTQDKKFIIGESKKYEKQYTGSSDELAEPLAVDGFGYTVTADSMTFYWTPNPESDQVAYYLLDTIAGADVLFGSVSEDEQAQITEARNSGEKISYTFEGLDPETQLSGTCSIRAVQIVDGEENEGPLEDIWDCKFFGNSVIKEFAVDKYIDPYCSGTGLPDVASIYFELSVESEVTIIVEGDSYRYPPVTRTLIEADVPVKTFYWPPDRCSEDPLDEPVEPGKYDVALEVYPTLVTAERLPASAPKVIAGTPVRQNRETHVVPFLGHNPQYNLSSCSGQPLIKWDWIYEESGNYALEFIDPYNMLDPLVDLDFCPTDSELFESKYLCTPDDFVGVYNLQVCYVGTTDCSNTPPLYVSDCRPEEIEMNEEDVEEAAGTNHPDNIMLENELKVYKVICPDDRSDCLDVDKQFSVHVRTAEPEEEPVSDFDIFIFESDEPPLVAEEYLNTEKTSQHNEDEPAESNAPTWWDYIYHKKQTDKPLYFMIRRNKGDGPVKVAVRARLDKSIRVVTSNVGYDDIYTEALICKEINVKLCSNQAATEYRNWISDLISHGNKPDIINIQEVVTRENCDNVGIEFSDEYCALLSDDYPLSICCDFTNNATEFLFQPIGYSEEDIYCNGNECTIINSERFEVIGSYNSYYPSDTFDDPDPEETYDDPDLKTTPEPCSDNGASVNTIVLKDKLSERVFVVGNAHPEVGYVWGLIDGSPYEASSGFWFKEPTKCDICRGYAIKWLLRNDGIPGNSIITGDFNVDIPQTQNFDEMAYSPKQLYLSLKKGGYQEIANATDSFGNQLDHIYSNLDILSASCQKVKFRQSLVQIHHESIFCELEF